MLKTIMRPKPVVLIILDGWGIGNRDRTNPLYTANPKNLAFIKSNFPSGSLEASGISVGLPWGEPGSSEIGHLNLGAGKVIYQNYPRISLAIRNGLFFKNKTILQAISRAQSSNGLLHLVGLISKNNLKAKENLRQGKISVIAVETVKEALDNL